MSLMLIKGELWVKDPPTPELSGKVKTDESLSFLAGGGRDVSYEGEALLILVKLVSVILSCVFSEITIIICNNYHSF